MADIEIRARAFWTDVEGDTLAVGFAVTEDPEDGYVVLEGPPARPEALYLELSDDIFAATGAVDRVEVTDQGFVLAIAADMAAKFGMVHQVQVFVAPEDGDGQAALAVLRRLIGQA